MDRGTTLALPIPMNTTHKVSKTWPAIKAILAATFPQFKGRNVNLVLTDALPTSYTTGLWDGGSRTIVKVYNLRTGGVVHADVKGDVSVAGDNWIIVESSTFCGSPTAITIRAMRVATDDVISIAADVLYSDRPKFEAQALLSNDASGWCAWGSYDRGHEVVTALDIAWCAVEAVSFARKRSDAKAVAS